MQSRDCPLLASDWSGSPPSNQSNSSDFVPPTCLDSAHLPQNVFELVQATLTQRTLAHAQETSSSAVSDPTQHTAPSPLTARCHGPSPTPPAMFGV